MLGAGLEKITPSSLKSLLILDVLTLYRPLHHTAHNYLVPFPDQMCHMVHFTPTRLYFIITGFILTRLSQDDRYGLTEDYYSYIYIDQRSVAHPI